MPKAQSRKDIRQTVKRKLRTLVKPAKHAETQRLTPPQLKAIYAFMVASTIVVIAGLIWAFMPFSVIINGEAKTANKFTSLTQLCLENKDAASGDFVAVDGSALLPGAGELFSATINGTALEETQLSSYVIQPEDSIVFSKGKDTTEPYVVSDVQEVAPKLEHVGEVGSVTYVEAWPYAGKTEKRTGLFSGKTAEVVVQPVQNARLVTKNIHPQNGEKLVALTFDDGPSQYTERYLDILDQFGAHATFFELGSESEKLPQISKEVQDRGMEVGTHTYGHELASKLSPEALQNTLKKGIEVLSNEGISTSMLRPPYGDFNLSSWLHNGGILSSAIKWTNDSEDWKKPGVDAIVQNALANITNGSIILMHDGGGDREQDLQALPQILQALSDEGYKVVTVSELLKSDPSIPKEVAEGTATMPEDATWPTELS